MKFRLGQKVSCTEGLPWFVGTVIAKWQERGVYLIRAEDGALYARLENELDTEGFISDDGRGVKDKKGRLP